MKALGLARKWGFGHEEQNKARVILCVTALKSSENSAQIYGSMPFAVAFITHTLRKNVSSNV